MIGNFDIIMVIKLSGRIIDMGKFLKGKQNFCVF